MSPGETQSEVGAGGGDGKGAEESRERDMEEQVQRGGDHPNLGMAREFAKSLKVRNLRPFLRATRIQVKLEDSIIVKRSVHGPDPVVTQFVWRRGCIARENQVLGLEAGNSQSLPVK